jgi:hypothetical protein
LNNNYFYTGVIQAFERYLMPVKVLMSIGVLFGFIMMSANLAFIAGFPTFFIEAVGQMFLGKYNSFNNYITVNRQMLAIVLI